MTKLPTLLVSSVVRGTRQGDSHGGLYRVDLERGNFEQVVDWNTCEINFEGRGADRGLRGVLIHDDRIYVAASDELFVFNRRFEILSSFRNRYLKHCHEIFRLGRHIYLTSTGFDSILTFDLDSGTFDKGLRLERSGTRLRRRLFDPNSPFGPGPSIEFHINNVFADEQAIYVSGRSLGALLRIRQNDMTVVARLPFGTHNARPFARGVLFNDSEADCLTWIGRDKRVAIPVPRYPEAELCNLNLDESGIARQAFGRGLCPISDNLVAGGSSPSTVSL